MHEQYATAAQVIARVLSGESQSAAREAIFARQSNAAVRHGAQSHVYGTLRAYGVGPALLRHLLHRPVADKVLLSLLYVALTDLRGNPDHGYTIVDQAVHAAVLLGRVAAKGLVNAVLRNYLRRRDECEGNLERDREALFAHPAWWIDKLAAAYPAEWREVLAAGNAQGPFCLRVNQQLTTVADYLERIASIGATGRKAGPSAVIVEPARAPDDLPGFAEGLCSVQDAGAQCAALLLDLMPGQKILDACAAPGGKAAHILERCRVDLTAVELEPQRAARVTSTLERLRLHAVVKIGDAGKPDAWWDGRRYDRIIADAPCSASGVARRNPDIKWLRRQSDVAQFARAQKAMLQALWPLLKPGGKLLYVTCSVFPDENQQVVEFLRDRFADAEALSIDAEQVAKMLSPREQVADGPARACAPAGAGVQIMPTADHDGFFYALLHKRSA